MNNNSRSAAPLRVLIIGAGFAGIGLAIKLRQAGIEDFLILEKADEVGGCWRENHYPGAACDVPSHLYSYSFEPNPHWSRKFAPQAEIFAYLRHCADKYGIRPFIRFGREVSEARFDAASGQWQVRDAEGEVYQAQALISATGQLSRPQYPHLPGLETFAGPAFHSAHWRDDLDLRGKRVAVIGTGASAIQFVPQIAPQVDHLSLFQRSAAYVLPKPDRPYTDWERRLKTRFPLLQRLDRAIQYVHHESRLLGFAVVPALMKLMRLRTAYHLRRGIADADLRKRLQPDYPMGCKRILISNDYYPALRRDNVAVVNTPIREVVANGIVTTDGHLHEVDALIYGTGFAATDFLAPMAITGLDGRELNAAWREGAQAYKGISVSGFPNLFILYGPNTNLGHNSIVYMLESQFPYVMACLQRLQSDDLRYLDVKAPVQQAYDQHVQQALRHTVWEKGCDSWYKTAAGRNTNNWPGFTFRYRQQTRTPEFADYDLVR